MNLEAKTFRQNAQFTSTNIGLFSTSRLFKKKNVIITVSKANYESYYTSVLVLLYYNFITNKNELCFERCELVNKRQ